MSDNLIIISEANHQAIIDRIAQEGITRAHFTNGSYAHPSKPIGATTLVGYQYLRDQGIYRPGEAVVIAANSHSSIKRAIEAKIAKGTANEGDVAKIEGQVSRAMKPAVPLAVQMAAFQPDEKVFVCFYDEDTPTAFYEAVSMDGRVRFGSLHKNGYGTNPNEGRIEGTEFAEHVFGFPLPDDLRPLYHDLTRGQEPGDADKVVVENLTTKIGPHGSAYITPSFDVLIPLAPASGDWKP